MLEEGGYYKLLGRTSVDIIKHGGYKVGRPGGEGRRGVVVGTHMVIVDITHS